MVSIQTMTISDFNILKNKLTENFDNFWKPETLETELLNENSEYIIAKDENGEILGFAGIWKSTYDVHITNIVTKKDIRHKGIGSLLLEKLIDISKKHSSPKFEAITLEVNNNNTPAINLYLKYGFEKVGIRKKYYKNTEDALIMTKKF